MMVQYFIPQLVCILTKYYAGIYFANIIFFILYPFCCKVLCQKHFHHPPLSVLPNLLLFFHLSPLYFSLFLSISLYHSPFLSLSLSLTLSLCLSVILIFFSCSSLTQFLLSCRLDCSILKTLMRVRKNY